MYITTVVLNCDLILVCGSTHPINAQKLLLLLGGDLVKHNLSTALIAYMVKKLNHQCHKCTKKLCR